MVDTTDAVVVEVKSKLNTKDVDEHVVRYAERKGLFVIGQKGEDATILNSKDFQPTVF